MKQKRGAHVKKAWSGNASTLLPMRPAALFTPLLVASPAALKEPTFTAAAATGGRGRRGHARVNNRGSRAGAARKDPGERKSSTAGCTTAGAVLPATRAAHGGAAAVNQTSGHKMAARLLLLLGGWAVLQRTPGRRRPSGRHRRRCASPHGHHRYAAARRPLQAAASSHALGVVFTTLPSMTAVLPSRKAMRDRPSQFLNESTTRGWQGSNTTSAISLALRLWGALQLLAASLLADLLGGARMGEERAR